MPALFAAAALCLAAYATIQTMRKTAELEVQVELLRGHVDSPAVERQKVVSLLSSMETRLQSLNARFDRFDKSRPASGEEIAAFAEEVRVLRGLRDGRAEGLFDMYARLDQARGEMRNEIVRLQTELLQLRGQVLRIMQDPTESRLMPANRE